MSSGGIRAGKAFVEVTLQNKIKEGARSVQNTLSAISSSIKSFGGAMVAAGATATAAFGGILGALAWPTKLAADMETTRAGFQAMLGDVDKVNKVMSDLQKFAQATPFEFPELADSARMLMAFGVSSKDLISTLRAVGDVSSGINAPLQEIAEIYGKARVQGRLFMVDINQLTGRGIPIIQELSKQFNVTDDAVRELVESGKVNFKNLEQAFVDLTSKSGIFANQMAVKSKTIMGLFSSLKDAISFAVMPIGEELVKALKPIVVAATSILIPIGEFISKNRQVVTIIAAVAAAGAAVGGVLMMVGGSIFGAGAALGGLAGLIPTIVAGLTAIGGALTAAAPVIGAIAAGLIAVGAAVAGVVYLAYKSGLLKEVFVSLSGIVSKLGKTFGQTFGGIADALAKGNVTQAVDVLWAGVKLAFLQGAKYALETMGWLARNTSTIFGRMLLALLETTKQVFLELPKMAIQAFMGGSGSLTDIVATALSQGIMKSFDDSIAEAQSQLDALTAKTKQGGGKGGADSPANKLKTPEQLKADELATKAAEAFGDRKKALQEEILEMRLGANAADLAKLAQQGLNDEQLASIKALQLQRDALKAKAKAEEEAAKATEDAKNRAQQMREEVATPLEIFQRKMKEIADLQRGGFLDPKTANLQRDKARDELMAPLNQRNEERRAKLRDSILNGRNGLVSANSQAAFDMIRASQRQSEVDRLGLGKRTETKTEEYARRQVELLEKLVGKDTKGGKIDVKTRRI